MLVDARTYTIKPGFTAAHLKIYEEIGFHAQVRHLGEPLCYLYGESGEMNTLLHCWSYKDAADREQRRAALMKDPDWKKYLDACRTTGYITAQRTSLMVPARFAPIRR